MEGPDAIKFDEEFVSFTSSSSSGKKSKTAMTLWEKVQDSLTPNLPRDLQSTEGQSMTQIQVQQQALSHFWAFLKGLLIATPTQNASGNEKDDKDCNPTSEVAVVS